jgi:hypothetical protein
MNIKAAIISFIVLISGLAVGQEPADNNDLTEFKSGTITQAVYVDQAADTSERYISPTGALFRSLFVPGWGQFSNRKYIKAGIIFGGEIALAATIIHYREKASNAEDAFNAEVDPTLKQKYFDEFQQAKDDRNLFGWYLGTLVFLSMFDAFVDAHLADFPKKNQSVSINIAPDEKGIFGIKLALNF